jgi:hypothetical protein
LEVSACPITLGRRYKQAILKKNRKKYDIPKEKVENMSFSSRHWLINRKKRRRSNILRAAWHEVRGLSDGILELFVSSVEPRRHPDMIVRALSPHMTLSTHVLILPLSIFRKHIIGNTLSNLLER